MEQPCKIEGIATVTYTTDGPNNYSQDPYTQRMGREAVLDLLTSKIPARIKNASLSGKSTFRIADLGCSTGPYTFMAMKSIIEVINLKYKSVSQRSPEFQVFFNDQSKNDFNTLFKNIPPSLPCFVAGAPGSFHDRLFPKASLDIVHTSASLHWLSEFPASTDKKMYSDQFQRDMKRFFEYRAEEIVCGGFMVIQLPVKGSDDDDAIEILPIKLLREAIIEMAKMGVLKENVFHSWNTPIYIPSLNEVKYVIETSKVFNIEEIITWIPLHSSLFNAKAIVEKLRVVAEQVVKHYASDVTDQLFNIFTEKVEKNKHMFENENRKKDGTSFLLLKRKED